MLTIEPPFYTVRGVTLFRDDADPDLFHALPAAPRLAARGDGQALTLFKYRRDLTDNPELDPTRARGAGLALFEVEMPLERAALLAAEVGSLAGRSEARVAPILFRSGEVRAIVAHAEGDHFVEDLVESRRAPLVAPHHSAFALALSAEGATLYEQALRGGELPVGVAYELRFLALTPALDARVRMDYERIYDHFAVSVGFTYYVSVKLDLDLAWLVEHDFIHIDIVSYTDGEDRDRQQRLVMELVKARIAQDFFRTGLPPKPAENQGGPLAEMLAGLLGGEEVTSASALFVLKAKVEVVHETKAFELVYAGRTAVELTHVASGFLATMVDPDRPPDVREIDLDDPFFSALDVQVVSTIDFQEMADLREAAVHLSFRDHRTSYRFAADAPGPYRFQAALTDPRADEYSWESEYHFDPDTGCGPTSLAAGPWRSRRRVLVLDPLAHFRYRRLKLLRGPVDPALVPRLRVRLRIPGADGEPDLVRSEVDLDAQHPEELWRARLPMAFETPRLLAGVDWEDPRGEVHVGEEVEVTGTSFAALGPYRDVLEITVQPAADWTRLGQLVVEVRYGEGEALIERRLIFAAATANAPATVQIPLLDPTRRAYRHRQTLFRNDGTVTEGEWTDSDATFLVVGQEAAHAGEVRVVWVGAAGEALGLRVDFWVAGADGEEGPVSTFLRAGEMEARVTLPFDSEGKLAYRYQVQRFTAAGEELVRVGEGKSNLLVVQAGG